MAARVLPATCCSAEVVGKGVKAATGAAFDHKPNPVIVTLQLQQAHTPLTAFPRREAAARSLAPTS